MFPDERHERLRSVLGVEPNIELRCGARRYDIAGGIADVDGSDRERRRLGNRSIGRRRIEPVVHEEHTSLFLACALVERGDHREALTLLEPVVAEFEEFAIPQWHAFAATLTGESLRGLGRIEEAEKAVRNGLQIATRAGYTFAAGFGNVVEGRLALEREKPDAARAAFLRALETFERSGATFEAARTRAEIGRLERVNG